MSSLFDKGGIPPVIRHWHYSSPRKKGYTQQTHFGVSPFFLRNVTFVIGRIKNTFGTIKCRKGAVKKSV